MDMKFDVSDHVAAIALITTIYHGMMQRKSVKKLDQRS